MTRTLIQFRSLDRKINHLSKANSVSDRSKIKNIVNIIKWLCRLIKLSSFLTICLLSQGSINHVLHDLLDFFKLFMGIDITLFTHRLLQASEKILWSHLGNIT